MHLPTFTRGPLCPLDLQRLHTVSDNVSTISTQSKRLPSPSSSGAISVRSYLQRHYFSTPHPDLERREGGNLGDPGIADRHLALRAAGSVAYKRTACNEDAEPETDSGHEPGKKRRKIRMHREVRDHGVCERRRKSSLQRKNMHSGDEKVSGTIPDVPPAVEGHTSSNNLFADRTIAQ